MISECPTTNHPMIALDIVNKLFKDLQSRWALQAVDVVLHDV